MPKMTGISRTGVTFLTTSLGSGGAEKHTLQLFNSLDQARFSASLAYLKRYQGAAASSGDTRPRFARVVR